LRKVDIFGITHFCIHVLQVESSEIGPMENRPVAVATSSTSRLRNVDLPSRQRARRTNDPLASIDMNTARGRRVADLVRAYLRSLGNPAGIEQQAAIIAAAELQVLAEEVRTTALRDAGHADLDQVIRLQGAADRAVRRLGIKPAAKPAFVPLRERWALEVEAESKDTPDAESLTSDVPKAAVPPDAAAVS